MNMISQIPHLVDRLENIDDLSKPLEIKMDKKPLHVSMK